MTQRRILSFWLPLFASWLLMTAEGPIISASVNRLPNEVVMVAAQGIVISLSVFIESPIINMLATATALVKDRASFLLVRRFTIHWMVALTVLTILIGFTPLYDVVVGQWLGVPANIAKWVRPGMQIMTLWSAAIAWRRFLQGVLIQFDQTRKVAWGTAVRLLASGGTAIGLAIMGEVPGVILAASAWMVGVMAEALYATLAIRPLLQNELSETAPSSAGEPLTYSTLFWFHLPLAATSVLTLLAQPLVTSSLARLPNEAETLAAWPMVFQMMLMMRAAAFALPEVVIALSDKPDSFAPLRRFGLTLTGITVVLMSLLAFTPLAGLYLTRVQDTTEAISEVAVVGVRVFLLLPAFTVLISWLRGILIHKRMTKLVNAGMLLNLGVTIVVLLLGVWRQNAGIPTAALALTLSLMVELAFLWWYTEANLALRLFAWQPA